MTLDQSQSRLVPASARTNPFRRNRNITPLAPESAQRQGAISALAFQLLGGRDAALDFLNTENKPLGGRPIAVAPRSAAGYECVERAIHSQSAVHGSPGGSCEPHCGQN